ncbi:hypothetical protein VPH35_017345 [Triticum aestivum]
MEIRCPDCLHPRSGAGACTVCHALRRLPHLTHQLLRRLARAAGRRQPLRFLLPAGDGLFWTAPAHGEPLLELPSYVFDDDEPVEKPPAVPLDGHSAVREALVLKTHRERPAVARGSAHDGFAVLVHAKAPGAPSTAEKTPVDLVTVLDVSGSMVGRKLELLKDAMEFLVDNLGPADRLSVVSFSDDGRRVTPLTRMSDAGKASAKLAVQSLFAGGGTDILKGLEKDAKVLDSRRHKNVVAGVILLSDGQDNYLWRRSYRDLVPTSLRNNNNDGRSTAPIHTFGFGTDHDPAAMHAVAELTGGSYSFIENEAVVQDAFAQCIGGLLSVTAQQAWIAIACVHPEVRVRAVKSGRYKSRVLVDGRAASVDVGELYADEERRFLLFVDVPRVVGAAADEAMTTSLVKVSCTYKDTTTGKWMEVAAEDAVVRRPLEVTVEEPSTEVEVEPAQAAAERGDHAEAARILDMRQKAAVGDLVGDPRCRALVHELAEFSARVATAHEYERTGRSTMLSGMSSHGGQRASCVSLFGTMASAPAFAGSAAGAFATPAMKGMVDSSRKTREQRQQQPPVMTTRPKEFAWSFYLVMFLAVVVSLYIDYILGV